MAEKIILDGVTYDPDFMSDTARSHLATLRYLNKKIEEATHMKALLTKAKNAYIAELKAEMVQSRTGFLFDDD